MIDENGNVVETLCIGAAKPAYDTLGVPQDRVR